MTVKYINGIEAAPKAIGPYSQATQVGNLTFLSGQVPIDPATGKLVSDQVEQQAHQVMKNLQSVLKGLEMDFSNVCKTTILLTDLSHCQKVNEIYAEWLKDNRPARATFQVAGLPLGAQIEIEMIAAS